MATKYEYYNTGDDAEAQVMWGAPYWGAQTFTPSIAHTITSVKLKLQRHGTPGNLTVSIRATTEESPWIITPDLITATTDGNTLTDAEGGEWREIFLGEGLSLLADTKYAICARCYGANVTNHVGWRYDKDDATYAGGELLISTNGGSTWSTSGMAGSDLMFEEWGAPAVSAPTVTTQAVSGIEATAATGNGNITATGEEDCDKRGFVYGPSSHGDPGNTAPEDSDYAHYVEETDGFGTGAFTGALTGLEPYTPYYVRAYAHNSEGYSYGDEVSFTTLAAIPTVTTEAATSVEALTATLNGILEDDGGEACDVRFQYGETLDYGINTDWQLGKESVIAFEQALTGLDPNKTYHFRAQARNSAGTVNGDDRTFTTLVALPTVNTNLATGQGAIAATLNGTLDHDGGEACDCGFEWGPDVDKDITTPTESKTTDETFSQIIGGLAPNTPYHFRAFATNSFGTGYGADRTFTTALIISRAFALAREEL